MVSVKTCALFCLPQQSRNGPEMEILRVQMYGRPSKNIFLGRATSEYHALTRIKTGARQETLRSS